MIFSKNEVIIKISIITPNYNYSQFIGNTIESVMDQDYENIEHIIVDDGSTDNSVKIILNYQKKYPGKIKLIKQENKGQTAALNAALSHVTGDIIGWLNSDDTFCNNVFTEIVSTFKKNKCDIVYGDVNVVDMQGEFMYKLRHLKFNYIESFFTGYANSITSNAVFWKSFLTKEVGSFDERFLCNMDSEYFSRLCYKKKPFYLKRTIANFRKQLETMEAKNHSNWDEVVKKEHFIVQEKVYKKLKISKYISIKYFRKLKYLYLLKRFSKRVFKMHYIKKIIEKRLYKQKRKNENS